jgi:hypothetical protein
MDLYPVDEHHSQEEFIIGRLREFIAEDTKAFIALPSEVDRRMWWHPTPPEPI